MPRHWFGGTSADQVVRPFNFGASRLAALAAFAEVTFWDAVTGGTRHLDLLLDGASPVDAVPADEHGYLPRFQGPDGVQVMWADMGDGTPRRLMVTTAGAIAAAEGLASKIDVVEKGAIDGVAELGPTGKIVQPVPVALLEGVLDQANLPEHLDPADLSAEYATKPDNGARAVGKGELVLNVKDFGAVGDGVTNDANAINAAITAANAAADGSPAVVWLPWTPTGYASGAVVMRSNVVLRGENRVVLKRVGAATSVFVNATGQTNVTVENLTIDASGLASSSIVRASTGTTFMTVHDCHIRSSVALSAGVYAYDCQTGTADLLVENCWFDGLADNIRMNQGPQRVTIRRNLFSGWKERCIYVLGTATAACTDLRIEGNVCRDMAQGGSVRQPITVQGNDAVKHRRVFVNNNTVIGPGLSYSDPTTPGTADQISLHRCEEFEVIGNISVDSGEVGITIAQQCSGGVIANNVVTGSDNPGLALGSSSSTYTRDLTVSGNVFLNNGKSRDGGTPANARVGAYLYNVSNVTLTGNRIGDNQGTKTQLHAYFLNTSSGIRFAGNNNLGNATGVYNLGAGNSDVTEASMVAVV